MLLCIICTPDLLIHDVAESRNKRCAKKQGSPHAVTTLNNFT